MSHESCSESDWVSIGPAMRGGGSKTRGVEHELASERELRVQAEEANRIKD